MSPVREEVISRTIDCGVTAGEALGEIPELSAAEIALHFARRVGEAQRTRLEERRRRSNVGEDRAAREAVGDLLSTPSLVAASSLSIVTSNVAESPYQLDERPFGPSPRLD